MMRTIGSKLMLLHYADGTEDGADIRIDGSGNVAYAKLLVTL